MLHRDGALLREMTNKRAHSFESLGYKFCEASRRQIKNLIIPTVESELHRNTSIYMTTNYKDQLHIYVDVWLSAEREDQNIKSGILYISLLHKLRHDSPNV